MLNWLQSDPIGFITFMLYRAPAVLIALTLHEIAHGYAALRCGDNTAKMLGRLSLNPLKHLDPIGTVCMFLLGMGWAKPVPVNPRNFRNYRRDDIVVSLAGVSVNLLFFLIATIVSIGLNQLVWKRELWSLGALTTRTDFLSFSGTNFYALLRSDLKVYIQAASANSFYVTNASEYLYIPWLLHVQRFILQFAFVNLGMCIFNLLPFPPLDGFHVFNDIILRGKLHLNPQIMRIGIMVLLFLSFATDIIGNILGTAVNSVQGVVLRGVLSLFGLS